ncbi:MAG: MATE family efflux transporter [Lachnospiraceae bacterium]|nr:MATE family efflux transporter [Lachnospiraceae bacterium]MDY5522123.1 MATE family efflux transporter [Agathobacter sp.]
MASNTTKDMTTGSSMKLILGFAVPLLMGMLFQQVYSLVDTIIVGRFLGVNALAAVGATGSINFLIIGFCLGLCNGFALPVAQRFGAKDYDGLRKYVGNSAVLSVIVGGTITIFTVVFCRNILQIMDTPADIIDLSYNYIVVIFAGIPATLLYNILSSHLRSLGDSVTPVAFLILSACLNIGLDLLFIVTFHWGVFGASFATVLSQLVSGVLCLVFIIIRFDILHLKRDDWRLDPAYVRNLLVMGLPMGFQYSITAIGSVILQAAVNSLGSIAVASMTAAGKISMFVVCPFDALGSTMATYGGQNVGAGKLERLGKGLRSAVILGAIYSAVIFVVVYFFGENMIQIFLSPTEENAATVLAWAKEFLVINAAFYFPLALVNIVRFLIQGMGFSGFAVFAGVFEMVARTIVGLFLVPVFGFIAACFASPLAWIFADAFLIPAFFFCRKRLRKYQH